MESGGAKATPLMKKAYCQYGPLDVSFSRTWKAGSQMLRKKTLRIMGVFYYKSEGF